MCSLESKPAHFNTPRILALSLTSECQNQVNFPPFIFRENWYIFFRACSFMFLFFVKQSSSYKWIFEYEFDITKYCLVRNLGRLIWIPSQMISPLLTSKHQNRVNILPFVIHVKYNNCCQISSIMLHFWGMQISSHLWTFEYKFERKEDS